MPAVETAALLECAGNGRRCSDQARPNALGYLFDGVVRHPVTVS